MFLLDDLFDDIKYTARQTYPADGVDLLDRKQNDSEKLFNSAEGRAYRNSWLTITLAALGFSTRQLEEEASSMTLSNFFKNYFMWRPRASWPKFFGRAAAGFIINSALLIPRAVVGIAKVVTEVIPGTVSRYFLNTGEDIVNSGIEYIKAALSDDEEAFEHYGVGSFIWGSVKALIGGVFYGVGVAAKAVYLTGCTLTSPIETVRSSWRNGHFLRVPFSGDATKYARESDYIRSMNTIGLGLVGKIFFTALSVVGSFITFGLTGPFAVKALGVALAPIAGKNAASAVTNAIDKIGNVKGIGPVLTKIGEGFNWVLSRPGIAKVVDFLRVGPTLRASPAVIGLGAVVGAVVSTFGTILNAAYKRIWLPVWHNRSDRSSFFSSGRGSSADFIPLNSADGSQVFGAAPPTSLQPLSPTGTSGSATPLLTENRNDDEETETSTLASAPGEGFGTGRLFDRRVSVPATVRQNVDTQYRPAAISYRS